MSDKNKEKKHLLPAEERWKYAAEFWVETLVGTLKELGKLVGWEKLNEAFIISAETSSWPGIAEALEKHLNITDRDARAWGDWDMFVGHNAFPGVTDEFVEYGPEKVHLILNGNCVLYDKMKEEGLLEYIDLPTYCSTAAQTAVETINKKLKFTPIKKICQGNDCCECTVVLQKEE